MMLRDTKEVHEIDFCWIYLLRVEVGSGDEELSVTYDGY